jgi:hypothetical protein
MSTGRDASDTVETVLRGDRDAVERALVEFDAGALRDLGASPDAVVESLFTPAFVDANTDFPDFEAFLAAAGAGTVWDLGDWLDWVFDWHVLGNTRFWSWEWMVHAAVAVRARAAAVEPVHCTCGGPVASVTASEVEEPGRADGNWVAFRCTDCGQRGRAMVEPDGAESLDGLERG